MIFPYSRAHSALKQACISAFSLFCIYSNSGFSQKIYREYEDGSIYVKLKNDVFTEIRAMNEKVNLSDVPFLKGLRETYKFTAVEKPFYSTKTRELERVYRLSFPDPARVDELIKDLYRNADVEYAEKIPLDFISYTPNDPLFASNQWFLSKIGAENAWEVSRGDSAITVAIVDNAIAIGHHDLSANIWTNPKEIAGNGQDDDNNGYADDIHGWDVAGNDNDPTPANLAMSHGTLCTGNAAAVSDNDTGIASIGFRIRVIAVKCTRDTSAITKIDRAYDGINYAAAAGARIISCSWGSSTFSQTNQAVIKAAYDKGCIILAGSGNANTANKFYPAAYDHVLSVASSDRVDKKSSFSNYGDWIDITAPGSSIYSTLPNGGYQSASGTSMAAPIVAGLCGLMLSKNPSLTPAQVEACLKASAINIDHLNTAYTGMLGAGRINAEAALKCVAGIGSNGLVANFKALTDTCSGKVIFTDQSVNAPAGWTWDFGNGQSSTDQHPVHTYTQSGAYTVKLKATNAGGSHEASKDVYVSIKPPQVPVVADVKKCGPGIILLSASAPGGTFHWYGTATSDSILYTGATYSPQLTHTTLFYVANTTGAGCISARVPINAIIHALPPIPVITKNGDELVSTPAASHQWNLDGTPISGATHQTYPPLKSGIYSVTVTDQNGCSSTSLPFEFFISGKNDNACREVLRSFPNPTAGKLFIESFFKTPGKIQLRVWNTFGALVFSGEMESGTGRQRYELDLQALPAGMYILQLKSGQQVGYGKISKE